MTAPLLLSVNDVLDRLGVSRSTLWRLIDAGSLDARRIGRKVVVTRESVDAFIAALPVRKAKPKDPSSAVHDSTGNVFADLDLPSPQEESLNARLAMDAARAWVRSGRKGSKE